MVNASGVNASGTKLSQGLCDVHLIEAKLGSERQIGHQSHYPVPR